MPTEEEFNAIMACVIKAYIKYKDDEVTQEQVEIIKKWASKYLANKERARKNARKWNKEHRERHNEMNKLSYRRVKERKKNAKQEK